MSSLVQARALYRVQLRRSLAYRGQAALFVLTALFPLVLMAAWLALVAETGPVRGFTSSGITSYFVAATLVNHFTRNWLVWDWEQELRTGGVAAKMLMPAHPLLHFLADHLARMTVTGAVLVPVTLVVAAGLDGVVMVSDPLRLASALLAVAIGFGLSFVTAAIFASLAFWTTRVGQVYGLWWGCAAFLSGWLAPVSLLPSWLGDIAAVLPFQYMVGFPVEVLIGVRTGAAVLGGLVTGAAWLAVAFVGLAVSWSFGTRRFEAFGG
ncbi:MAG TPA: ABC-2 family transporter protein [Micromonosporaceae bacterium]|nr:ABC-2 family transporter protein [Micromonosporaceae bacterium]